MGMDFVELVLRCEETFGVALQDDRLSFAVTVGDLFELICEQLKLPCGPQAPRPIQGLLIPPPIAPNDAWTRDSVWFKLVEICVDQLRISPQEATYRTSFTGDLRID
jgi:acyl carrier protein